jgi:hypothetical protein
VPASARLIARSGVPSTIPATRLRRYLEENVVAHVDLPHIVITIALGERRLANVLLRRPVVAAIRCELALPNFQTPVQNRRRFAS